jgi:hypothetical protein
VDASDVVVVEVVVVVVAIEPEAQKIARFLTTAAAELRRRQGYCGGGDCSRDSLFECCGED